MYQRMEMWFVCSFSIYDELNSEHVSHSGKKRISPRNNNELRFFVGVSLFIMLISFNVVFVLSQQGKKQMDIMKSERIVADKKKRDETWNAIMYQPIFLSFSLNYETDCKNDMTMLVISV